MGEKLKYLEKKKINVDKLWELDSADKIKDLWKT